MALQPGQIASGIQAGRGVVASDLSNRLAKFLEIAKSQTGAMERTAIGAGLTPGGTGKVEAGGKTYEKAPMDLSAIEAALGGNLGGDTSVTVKPTPGVSITKKGKKTDKMTMAEAVNKASLIVGRDKDLHIGMMEQYSPEKKAKLAEVQQQRIGDMVSQWVADGLVDIPGAGGQVAEKPVEAGNVIRVRLKVAVDGYPVGQEGTINESEFDPKIHERV